VPGHPYERGFDLRLVPEKLAEPLRWSRARMIFVNSMSDLFHENVPDSYIVKVAEIMSLASWHVFQVLTKRSQRLQTLLQTSLRPYAYKKHIWWGVSVENKKHGIPRIQHLRAAPAAVRFLSVEPLLEDIGKINLKGISWVIVGGESGRNARSIEVPWVISIRDQCKRARVPFFFKQWGGINKKKSGRMLKGKSYDQFPDFATGTVPPKAIRLQQIGEIEGPSVLALL
jgi:protein gp37